MEFEKKSLIPIYLATFNATLGSFFFGYSLAIFNSIQECISSIENWGNEKDMRIGIITALLPFGCIFGAFFAGLLCSKFGRKNSFIIADLLTIVAAFVGTFGGFTSLCFFRILSGISVGINSVVVPLYISEISPANISGRLGSFTQVTINIGILFPFLFAFQLPADCEKHGSQWWRIMVCFPILTSLIRIGSLLFYFKLDTPASLMGKRQLEAARQAIRFTYPNDFERQEAKLKQLEFETNKAEENFGELFKGKTLKRLILAIAINVFQQFSGINAVVFYSNNIFKSNSNMQNSDLYSKIFTVAVSLILMFAALLSGLIVDKTGRKTVLVYGEIACILSLAALSICLFENLKMIAPILILIYLFSFGISLGPVVWLYVPEFINLKGCSIAGVANWLSCSIIGLTFLPLKNELNLEGAFLVYCFCCVGGLIYILIFAKETKGLNPQEVEKTFGDSIEDKKELLK